MFAEYAKKQILLKPRYRQWCAALGALLNRAGYALIIASRNLVRFMNHHVTHDASDWFIHDLPKLHKKVRDILERQRVDYGKYYYFYGYPYQALAILGIYGERSTEERFDAYALGTLVTAQDRVLDLGTNCGFVALYTALRTGCRAEGIDINPYMIEIGNECAKYLRISDRVHLHATKIQDFKVSEPYSIVFSFATHWTDDENYRVPLREHFERCASYLKTGGRLLFETHSADVGNAAFYSAIETFGDLFAHESKRDTDRGTRHLYLFRKH
ncbi:MAG: class I SAM-dependent methyltransferase [Alphaproteobacteria bacterium]